MMKTILIFLLSLITFSVSGQVGKRVKWKSGIERCLDLLGDPIENCFGVSQTNGEFIPTTIEDVATLLNVENNGAIDSIYSSANGDTLIVVYNNAPPLKYYAPGINGILSSGNNNKTIGGGTVSLYTTKLPVFGWNLTNNLSSPNNLSVLFDAGTFRRLSITSGQTESLRLTGQLGTTGSGRVWNVGSSGGSFVIKDGTGGVAPLFIQTTPTVGNTLVLESDGDIMMSDYQAGRPFSINPLNFAAWDMNGTMQMYEIQDLIDTIESSSGVQKLEINLTSTDITGMFTSPIIAIAGQANKVICVHRVTAIYRFGTVAYTGGGNVLFRDEVGGTTIFSSIISGGNMTSGSDKISNALPSSSTIIVEEGAGVELSNGTASFATGDGTLKLIVTYEIIDTQ